MHALDTCDKRVFASSTSICRAIFPAPPFPSVGNTRRFLVHGSPRARALSLPLSLLLPFRWTTFLSDHAWHALSLFRMRRLSFIGEASVCFATRRTDTDRKQFLVCTDLGPGDLHAIRRLAVWNRGLKSHGTFSRILARGGRLKFQRLKVRGELPEKEELRAGEETTRGCSRRDTIGRGEYY